MKQLTLLTFVMMVTCIVASCGTTSQMGGSGCFGYWNTDGPLRGTRDANRNRSYPYRQCVEKTVSHSWWKIGRWPPRDDIPSIDSPRLILAAEIDWLYSNSWVIGIEIEGKNRGLSAANFKLEWDLQRHNLRSSWINQNLPALWNWGGFSPGIWRCGYYVWCLRFAI